MADGSKIRKLITHSSSASVIKLGWSHSDKYFASADDSGRVIVKRLEPPSLQAPRKWAVFASCDLRLEEPVHQFLFSLKDDYLLISSLSSACLIALKTKKLVCKIERNSHEGDFWIQHPKNSNLLINITTFGEQEFEWSMLSDSKKPLHDSLAELSLGTPSSEILRTVQLRNRWAVLESSNSSGQDHHRSTKRHLEIIDLQQVTSSDVQSLPRRQTVSGIEAHIERLIGSFREQVVFLDRQFWVCTWELERTYTKHKRHFFLPKDWLTPLTLGLIALNQHGTLLCPKNGEVAIVRGGLKQ